VRLEEGDVLTVTRLDCLARSTRDLLNILETIGEAGASFKSLVDIARFYNVSLRRSCG
jgi:DNA invertase Pin-like site-specific DNA recombinase